jgi:dTMP kinase
MRHVIPGGLLVAVEGIDGAGKTSICTLLAQWCGERGLACVLSKEPTGLKWGRELRESAKSGRLTLERELELFELDRRDHVERSIRPALEKDYIVILDRYYWSTAAYQGARGADVEAVIARNTAFAPKPDIVLLLDVEVETGLSRIGARGDSPNQFEQKAALQAARDIFLKLAASDPTAFVIDSSISLAQSWKTCSGIFTQAGTEKITRQFGQSPEGVTRIAKFVGD